MSLDGQSEQSQPTEAEFTVTGYGKYGGILRKLTSDIEPPATPFFTPEEIAELRAASEKPGSRFGLVLRAVAEAFREAAKSPEGEQGFYHDVAEVLKDTVNTAKGGTPDSSPTPPTPTPPAGPVAK